MAAVVLRASGLAGVALTALLLAACGRSADTGAPANSVAGATGTSSMGAQPQPGSGLQGGLGTGASLPATSTATTSAPSGVAPGTDGSSNATPRSSVGNR